MAETDSTHEAAEKTERGEPVRPPAPRPGVPSGEVRTEEVGEGPPRQVQPDGR